MLSNDKPLSKETFVLAFTRKKKIIAKKKEKAFSSKVC